MATWTKLLPTSSLGLPCVRSMAGPRMALSTSARAFLLLGGALLAGCTGAGSGGGPGGPSGDTAARPLEPAEGAGEADGPETPVVPDLRGTWRVLALEGPTGRVDAPSRPPITIEFFPGDADAARVGGFSGVNNYGGTYVFSMGEMRTGGLWINSIVATMKAGPSELMEFERTFLDALGRSRTVTFNGREMTIETGIERIRATR